jgi:hypothetical protein
MADSPDKEQEKQKKED